MHHIGVGRTVDGTPVLLLINGYDIRIIHATTGEIIRTLTIKPQPPLPRHRQPHRRPPRTPKNQTDRTRMQVRTVSDVSRHHMRADDGNRTRVLSLGS